MIIGITGTTGAGKGTAVEFFKKFGFEHFSARNLLEREIKKRNIEATRINMINIADEWRKQNGPGYIVETLLKEANESKGNIVIESIRSVGEIETFRMLVPHGILLAIDADQKIRYERVFKRGASTDHITFEQFCDEEKKESEGTEKWRGNLPVCITMADVVMRNNCDKQEFESLVINFLKQHGIN